MSSNDPFALPDFPSHDAISERAYYLSERRGHPEGDSWRKRNWDDAKWELFEEYLRDHREVLSRIAEIRGADVKNVDIVVHSDGIEPPVKPINVFMITPFAEEYRGVEKAVRTVFESAPYYFNVTLARDFTYDANLPKNVFTHIDLADAFVAEITELNSNVMYELGRTGGRVGNARPVFSLRGADAVNDVPSDIKSELYIEYGSRCDQTSNIDKNVRIWGKNPSEFSSTKISPNIWGLGIS